MAIITTSSFAKDLRPGVRMQYENKTKEYPKEYLEIYKYNKSDLNYEEDVSSTGFSLAVVKDQGASITFDDNEQAWVSRYTHVVYGKGFIVSREMHEDGLSAKIGIRRATDMAFAMRQTRETVGANVLNRAFNSSYTMGSQSDGVELCSSVHPNKSSGTWRNELETAADLSEASLEQACIDIAGYTTDKGLKTAFMPRKLVVPRQLLFTATRILQSDLQSGGANNDVNALKLTSMFPEGICVNHYLTDTDAWFILTNAENGFNYFERRPDEFDVDNDSDTQNAKFLATGRYSFGWSDSRCVLGSEGA